MVEMIIMMVILSLNGNDENYNQKTYKYYDFGVGLTNASLFCTFAFYANILYLCIVMLFYFQQHFFILNQQFLIHIFQAREDAKHVVKNWAPDQNQ